jgi:hypothetical protein
MLSAGEGVFSMSDLPSALHAKRHWLEYTSTIIAVVVSVVSLWVAIGSEDANRKMVAASSWPFLQIVTGNSDAQNRPELIFSIANAGVGPAKVRSFEVFWRGKPYRSSFRLMHDCCGYEIPTTPPQTPEGELPPGQVSSSHVAHNVIRAGEERPFLSYELTAGNATVWKKFDEVRQNDLRYRVCYCSVFDECWIDTFDFTGDSGPERIEACPIPKVLYSE